MVGKRRLHLFESSGSSIAAWLSFCRLEEMKFIRSLILCAHALDTRSDEVSDLWISRPVSDFWGSPSLKFFTLGDLDKVLHGKVWTWADKSKVCNYRLHFTRFPPLTGFAVRRNRANIASDSFALIAESFLLQFTKPVIGLSKYVMGAAKKCGSSRQAVPRGFAATRARSSRLRPGFHQTGKPNRQATEATILRMRQGWF